ncbi:hypothetical protein [uncultured Prevotella sp.]|uniref:hypothetical protein n=1 Tax=uncultured Prevotella sp. TaxID=159272 RepID=UPI0025CF4285|nr:hypothetical protein [uncultured Prevotella sp.]
MSRISFKKDRLDIIFSTLMLLSAVEPVFGDILVIDYLIYGLMAVCAVLMLVFLVKDLIKDARGFISSYTSRSVFWIIDAIICLIGLAVGYAFSSNLVSCWIFLFICFVVLYFLPIPKGTKTT